MGGSFVVSINSSRRKIFDAGKRYQGASVFYRAESCALPCMARHRAHGTAWDQIFTVQRTVPWHGTAREQIFTVLHGNVAR